MFFSAIAGIPSTLLVATGNESFYLWANLLSLGFLGAVFGIVELCGVSEVYDQEFFISILLFIFVLSPLAHVALSLIAEYRKLIIETFKSITAPLWGISFLFLLCALLSKSVLGGSEVLRLSLVFVVASILCGFLVWYLRPSINGKTLGRQFYLKN